MGHLTVSEAVSLLNECGIRENAGTLRYKLRKGVISAQKQQDHTWLVDEDVLREYIRSRKPSVRLAEQPNSEQDVFHTFYKLYQRATDDQRFEAEVELEFSLQHGKRHKDDSKGLEVQLTALRHVIQESGADKSAWLHRLDAKHKQAVRKNMKLDEETLKRLLEAVTEELSQEKNVLKGLLALRALSEAARMRGIHSFVERQASTLDQQQ